MNDTQVDVAVIGGGTAGMSARRAALKNGAEKVVLIEGNDFGTTCARTGCMPSKLLIASAEAAHAVGKADVFGIHLPQPPTIDGRAVMQRVRRERDRFVSGVVETVKRYPPEERLRGHARFVGPTTLEVGDHTRVKASAVVLATGASSWIPAPYRKLGDRIVTTETLFEMHDLPRSVGVIGTGAIGLELGQALHRLGVRTTFFNPEDIVGPFADAKMKRYARKVLSEELDMRLDLRQLSATPIEKGVQVQYEAPDGRMQSETFAVLLAGAGRRPNLERLNLEASSLELDALGVPVFDRQTLQCGNAPVFIAGDASGWRPVLHEAVDDGYVAGHNAAAYPQVHSHVRRAPLTIVFCSPQMAVVGCPDPDDDGLSLGESSYEYQGRARVLDEPRGHVRIWAQRNQGANRHQGPLGRPGDTGGAVGNQGASAPGAIVGAELFGPQVEHTAHLLAWAVAQGMTAARALEMPFYHPVLEEGLRSALRDVSCALRWTEPQEPLEFGPGC